LQSTTEKKQKQKQNKKKKNIYIYIVSFAVISFLRNHIQL